MHICICGLYVSYSLMYTIIHYEHARNCQLFLFFLLLFRSTSPRLFVTPLYFCIWILLVWLGVSILDFFPLVPGSWLLE